jgi:exoribonuclease-2
MSAPTPTPKPGHGALLVVQGKLVPVWIEGREGSGLRTLSADGTCRIVSAARLYWPSDQALGGAGELAAWFEAMAERAATVDVASQWALYADEGVKEVDVGDLAQATLGSAAGPEVDAVVVALFDAGRYFRMRGATLGVRSREAVTRAQVEEDETCRRDKARAAAQERFATVLAGTTTLDLEDAQTLAQLQQVEAIALEGRGARGFKDTMDLVADLAPGAGEPELRARALLVRLGYFAADENLHVRRSSLHRRFSAELEAQAMAAASEPPKLDGRLDLRHLTTLAIDDARTTEVDDAFAVDGDRLVVFIADAAVWVAVTGALNEEAAHRATTVYLPEGKIPMLPPTLGEVTASLLEGEDRPALAFSFEIDDQGYLRAFEAAEAVCRVDHRLTYDAVDADLSGDASGPHHEILGRVALWMAAHRARRTAAGALHLQRSEVEILIEEDGAIEVVPVEANGPGRTLVSEMMVAVCAGVAQWCVDENVPVIYRSQAEPDSPPDATDPMGDPAAIVAILRTLKPTQQGVRPGRHYTLGVDGYCQVTSPLRRYLDLVNHRQIKARLRHRPPPHTAGDLHALVAQSEEATSRARRAMSSTRRQWLLRHMAASPQRSWSASVIRPIGKRWLAEIGSLAFQVAFLPSGWVTPGQSVELEVKKNDPEADVLRLDEVPRG